MLALYNKLTLTSKFHAGIDAPSLDIKNKWSQNNTDIKVFNLGFNPTSLYIGLYANQYQYKYSLLNMYGKSPYIVHC